MAKTKRRIDKKHRFTVSNRTNRIFKHTVFVDNNRDCWKNDMNAFAKEIHFIKAPDAYPNATSNKEWIYATSLAAKGNLYAKSLVENSEEPFKNYTPNDGLTPQIAQKLKLWADSIIGNKCAFFDWDKTITSVEFSNYYAAFKPFRKNASDLAKSNVKNKNVGAQCGESRKPNGFSTTDYINNIAYSDQHKMMSAPLAKQPTKFLDDAFEYLIRKDRTLMLKRMFLHLHKRGVEIHILTHNPFASMHSPFRPFFLEMMSRLFGLCNIGKSKLDSMLHSSIDYAGPGEPYLKKNIVCKIDAERASTKTRNNINAICEERWTRSGRRSSDKTREA